MWKWKEHLENVMRGKIHPAILFSNFCDFVAEHLYLLSPVKQAGHGEYSADESTAEKILVAHDRPVIQATTVTNNALQHLTDPLQCKCYSQIIFIFFSTPLLSLGGWSYYHIHATSFSPLVLPDRNARSCLTMAYFELALLSHHLKTIMSLQELHIIQYLVRERKFK